MVTETPTSAVGKIGPPTLSLATEVRTAQVGTVPGNDGGVSFAEELASVSTPVRPPNVLSELSAAKKFEAVFVAQMMANILPKDSDYFGEGFAGDAWRSMLSEQIANVAVTRTDFGIAPLIESGFAIPRTVGDAAAATAIDLQSMLAETAIPNSGR